MQVWVFIITLSLLVYDGIRYGIPHTQEHGKHMSIFGKTGAFATCVSFMQIYSSKFNSVDGDFNIG